MSSFADHLKTAEFTFLSEVAKAMNAKQNYVNCTVQRGQTTSWLEFNGVDKSDFTLEGTASVAQTGAFDVTLSVSYNSAYRGRGSDDVKLRTGELNVETVVRMIDRNIGF